MKRKGTLFIFSAPSGAGKDTVLAEVLKQNDNLKLSISNITRGMRQGEVEGEKYNFISKEKFEQMLVNKDFLEFNEYCGNYYGTPKAPVEKWLSEGYDVILEIDVNGAFKVKNKMPEAVMIFMLPPSVYTLKSRLEKRGTENADVVKKRLKQAKKEIEFARDYDFIFVNDDLDDAVFDLMAIIRANALLNENMQEHLGKVINDAKSCNWKID